MIRSDRILLGASLIVVLGFAACIAWAISEQHSPIVEDRHAAALKVDHPGSDLRVLHDSVRHMTCWETTRGLSCWPDWMLVIDPGRDPMLEDLRHQLAEEEAKKLQK